MSEPVTALEGRCSSAEVTISDGGLRGMITLRGDFNTATFQDAVKDATGLTLPDTRGLTQSEDKAVAWMSVDEVLLMLPYAQAAKVVARLDKALAGQPHLVADVSDARATIVLEGAGLRDVLAKGTPADLRPANFPPGEVRRTRLGQVAVAFWLTSERRAELVCFRSVAGFVFDWLAVAANDEGRPSYFYARS